MSVTVTARAAAFLLFFMFAYHGSRNDSGRYGNDGVTDEHDDGREETAGRCNGSDVPIAYCGHRDNVLTAIVISALLGATEFELAVRLWKVSRTECLIFFGAFFGVLLLGTINGVLIGIMLSFTEMIIRTAKPARCFLGIQTPFG